MRGFSLRRLWHRVQSTKAKRRQAAPRIRPGVEALEERVLLDGGLPAALTVGRTLSAYSVADLVNNRQTITYTIYNEQAEPISGVLLTETLQPGVTFESASQLPDRDGQDLAWSLGTIPGFGRASVSLTVALDSTVPLQLDGVTRAFAMLNGQMVTDELAPATLRTDVIPADLLASTPDANSSDPFIQAKAAALDYDPQRIFDYLHIEVGYNSYSGSLRGARGTLWSSAGNALDVASLGVALMRASGVPAQYVSGTLEVSQAQQLILSMFPQSYQTVGHLPAGTEVSDPANDPGLLDETKNHYWLQFDMGNGLQDADPLLAGAHIGQTFTAPTSTFPEVPDDLREKTRVTLTAEVYYQSDAAFGLDPFHRTVVLDQTFNDVDLVGRPLSVGHFVSTNSIGSPVFGVVTNTYSPYLQVGDEAFPDPTRDQIIRGQDYQEQLTNFPLGSHYLTGVFLNLTLSGVQGSPESYQHTILDRLGVAVRHHATTTQVAIDPSGGPALTDYDIITVAAISSRYSSAAGVGQLNVVQGLESARARMEAERLANGGNLTAATIEAAATLFRTEVVAVERATAAAFLLLSDLSTSELAFQALTTAYADRPRLIIASSSLTQSANSTAFGIHIDLRRDDVRAVVSPLQAADALTAFHYERGVLESLAEAHVLGERGRSTATIFQAAHEQGIALVALSSNDATRLASLDISAAAKALIVQAFGRNRIVLVPVASPTVKGATVIGWFEVDPATGVTIGVLEDGTHGSTAESGSLLSYIFDIFTSVKSQSTAASYALGFVTGTFLTTFAFATFPSAKLDLLKIAGSASSIGVSTSVAVAILDRIFDGGIPIGDIKALGKGVGAGIAFAALIFKKDPPLPDLLLAAPVSSPANVASRQLIIDTPLQQAAEAVEGNLRSESFQGRGRFAAFWSTTGGTTSFLLDDLGISDALVLDAAGATVDAGLLSLSAAGVALSVAGSNHYTINGTGRLTFYGPAETTLGVSGDWDDYTASVTGAITMRLTTDALVLNGTLLPAGTYVVHTNAATLRGRGLTTSPNFTGSVTLAATAADLQLGPGTGTVAVGGTSVELRSGFTLSGYTGNIILAAGGSDTRDDVTLIGNIANVLTVSAMPVELATDQNSPVTFQTNIHTSFADTYELTVQAPTGWTVTIDDTGLVTATPAPGLQDGTHPIQILARSQTNPDLVAQTTVNVSITPTIAGITLAVQSDPLFTVPFNGAQVPTAFQAVIHNDGPSTDSFNLSFANIPAGFTLRNSGTSITIPAGETGIVGVYLEANTTLLAPGTPLSFDVTATSTSSPAVTQTVTTEFAMPVVQGVTLAANPPQVVTTPGGSATTTLILKNVGNVAETVTLDAASFNVTVSELAPLTLAPGESATVSVTLSIDAAARLNSLHSARIIATFGSTPQTALASLSLQVRSAETVGIGQASVAAAQADQLLLATTLADLADSVSALQEASGNAALLSRVQLLLENANVLLNADPTLTPFALGLPPLQAAANSGDVAGFLDLLPDVFNGLANTLAVAAREKFTVSLAPSLIEVQPGQSKEATVQLANIGNDPVTLDLSLSGVPDNVTTQLAQTQVVLLPGETVSVVVTVANTLVSGKVFTLEVTAAASVVRHQATAAVSIRPALADVLAVTLSSTHADAGDLVGVSARVFNTANVARSVLAHLDILDAGNHVVSSLPDVPLTLATGNSTFILDLGQLPTAGLANGLFSVRVSLRLSDGSPLAGQAAQASLVIGPLVAAAVAASATIVAPGTSTVDTTITVSSPGVGTGIPTLTQSHIVYLGQDVSVHGRYGFAPAVILARNAVRFAAGGASNPSIAIIEDGFFPGSSPGDSLTQNLLLFRAGFSDVAQISPANLATANLDAFQVLYVGPTFNATNIAHYQAAVPNIQRFIARGGGLVVEPETSAPNAWSWVPYADQLGAFDAEQDTVILVAPGHPVMAGLSSAALSNWNSSTHSAFDPDPSVGFTVLATDANGNPVDLALVLDATSSLVSISAQIQHDLPGSGYSVDVGSIAPAADIVASTQVAWQTTFPPNSSTTAQFQLSGQVSDMAPGEVRQISLGTTVTSGLAEVVTSHSVADFSGTQGQEWYYGYYATPGSPASFTQMPFYTGVWQESATSPPYPYAHLWESGGFPGGPPFGPTHWAVRRWVSDVAGAVTITGRAAPADYNTGDGVRARAYVDGVQVWAHTFGRFDTSSSSFQLTQSVHVGSTIDFVIDPIDTIGSDAMTFTASISRTKVSEVQTLHLPALTVAAEHIISLEQATQSARRGDKASYNLKLTNPYATDATYSLGGDGFGGLTHNLPSSVLVPAGQTVTLLLDVIIPAETSPGVHVFQVFATTPTRAADSVEGVLTVSPEVTVSSLGVHVALQETQATAGQGTPATFTVRLTNVGDTSDTYNLQVTGLPSGIQAHVSVETIAVPPGMSNFREVTLTLTPTLATTPGDYPFQVMAASSTSASVSATTAGTLSVLGLGVEVSLDRTSAAPGTTFQLTVTNTGEVLDTFDLSLGGPGAFVGSLSAAQVTLAPGAVQTVSITTQAVPFALPGGFTLTAQAVSRMEPTVRDQVVASLTIPTTQGVSASFVQATQTLSRPGSASFVLLVKNTGNREDSFMATITGGSGQANGSLTGLDGKLTRTVPLFRLPGLSTGALILPATLTDFGQGSVTVEVRSLSDSSLTAFATATLLALRSSTSILLDAPEVIYGGNGTVTVTVLSQSGTPTGNVTLSVDNGPPVTLPLTAQGTAIFPIDSPNVGGHSLHVVYAEQGGFAASSADGTLVVRELDCLERYGTPTTPGGGNVTAVLTNSRLKILGDLAPNALHIALEPSGDALVLTGVDGTLVNGQTVPLRLTGVQRLKVLTGDGNDHLFLGRVHEESTPDAPFRGVVKVNTGRDNDALIVCDWDIAGPARLRTGSGLDRTVLHDTVFQQASSFKAGGDADTLTLNDSDFRMAAALIMGSGNDVVHLETELSAARTQSEFHGATLLNTGSGDDHLVIGRAGQAGSAARFLAATRLVGGRDQDILDAGRETAPNGHGNLFNTLTLGGFEQEDS